MKFAVIGAGGVGAPLGMALVEGGHDVTFVARGAHLAAMRERGLRLVGARTSHLAEVRATDDTGSVGPVDAIFFTVKSFGLEAAATALPPLLGDETAVVALQNGVEAEERIAAIIGDGYVMGGVAEISAAIEEPGVIRQISDYARIRFGELDRSDSPRGEAIRDAFAGTPVDAVLSTDIELDTWNKFVMLAAVSAITSAARSTFGALRSDPETRALLESAVAEAVAVGRAGGVALGEDAVARTMERIDGLPPQGRASMAVDLERGNPLELPWLSGAVVRLGLERGVATPVHDFVCKILKLHQDGRSR